MDDELTLLERWSAGDLVAGEQRRQRELGAAVQQLAVSRRQRRAAPANPLDRQHCAVAPPTCSAAHPDPALLTPPTAPPAGCDDTSGSYIESALP